MPVKDGLTAIREINRAGLGAQVLVLASFPDDHRVVAAINTGAIGLLLKDSPQKACWTPSVLPTARQRAGRRYVTVGEYLEIARPHRLVLTYGIAKFAADFDTISVQLQPDGDGCVLTLTHEGLRPGPETSTAGGWEEMFDLLAKALTQGTKGRPAPVMPGNSLEPSRYALGLLASGGNIDSEIGRGLADWLVRSPHGIGYLSVPLLNPPFGGSPGAVDRWLTSVDIILGLRPTMDAL